MAAAAPFGRCLVDEVMADGPRGYWRLDEPSGTAMASATGSNNGTYTNGPTLSQAGALGDPVNKAVRFDGVNDYAQVPDSAALDTGDTFTYEAWVRRAATGPQQAVVTKTSGMPFLAFDADGYLRLAKHSFGTVALSTIKVTDTSQWHHVVATKAGATVRLYIDGVDRTGTVTNMTMADNANPLRIGSGNSTEYFNGSIDEVAVYGTALSAARVRAHYNAGRCYRDEPRADSAQAQWRLGEPAGAFLAFDSMGTNNGSVLGPSPFGQAGLLDGDSDTAMAFDDASASEINLGDRFDFAGTAPFTAEAWIKRGPRTAGFQRVFDKFSRDGSDSPLDGWNLGLDPSSQRLVFERKSATVGDQISSSTVTAPNRTYHVVATYDGSAVRLYVNGVLEQSGPSTRSLANTTMPLRLGASSISGSDDQFDGTIDDAAIYSGALSADRIADHYIAGRSYRDVVMDDAPVAYWRLGESSGTTAASQTGTNNGSYVSSPARIPGGAVAGDADGAVAFNGTSQYVQVPDSASLDTVANAGMSLEIWFKRRTLGGAADRFYNLFSKNCNAFELLIDAENGKLQLYRNCDYFDKIADSDTLVQDLEWHHVVVTKSGATTRIYLDGVDVTVARTDRVIAANASPLRIGAWQDGGTSGDFNDGQVDDAAVYNRVLSAAEARLHYHAGLDSPR